MNKYCTGCQTLKETARFWKNKSTKDGFHNWCKSCLGKANKARLNGPKRAVELRQRTNRHLINKYNIFIDEYEELSTLQEHRCRICGEEEQNGIRLAVDHSHVDDRIRGLLCQNCNRGLGMFKDDVDRLQWAVKYLSEGWW